MITSSQQDKEEGKYSTIRNWHFVNAAQQFCTVSFSILSAYLQDYNIADPGQIALLIQKSLMQYISRKIYAETIMAHR